MFLLISRTTIYTVAELESYSKNAEADFLFSYLSPERKELLIYFFLLLKVFLSGIWSKKNIFENFQNLGSKGGYTQIDAKKSKILFLSKFRPECLPNY